MIALALLLIQASQPPVLAFPEPGVDDTAAYQGYQTRFHRDSKGNTVQIYLEPRAGRVVNLWADAVDESLGFTVRDAAGRAARLGWAADGARTADSGTVRMLEWQLNVESPSATIGWFLLGSMRVERDFQYAGAQRRPFKAPPFHVAEESLLVASVARLPRDERTRHLELLRAESLAALRSRLLPSLRGSCAATCTARIERPSLDGVNRLSLELGVDPREATMRVRGRTITFRSRTRAALRLTVRLATDAPALTPLARDSIFNQPFLDYLRREPTGDSTGPGRRLEREARSIELLSSREKLMAGLPNFATYFGRDMMMAALMMRPVWRPAMSEHVIASVLRKLSPRGDVSHEEALGGQAIRENASEYNRLMAAYFAARGRGRGADSGVTAECDSTTVAREPEGPVIPDEGVRPGAVIQGDGVTTACILARAREVLRHLQRTRENYHMLDDELQLPILMARYLSDSTVPAVWRRSFLLSSDSGGLPRLTLLLRELALVAAETRPYAADPRPTNLIGFVKRDSTHWRSASWRDSDAGYANGRYAMDINAIWAPRALEAIATIVALLPTLGIERVALDSLVPMSTRSVLSGYLADSVSLRRAIDTWRGARRHFVVTLAPEEVDRRVAAKLAWLPPAERAYWKKALDDWGEVRYPLTFQALSLDSAGQPIPVVNTDPATEIFLDATSSGKPNLDQLESIVRPYPVGLLIEGLGPVVANDAYASRRVWDTFAKDTYHGPRVVWGREVNLLLLGFAAAPFSSLPPGSHLRSAGEANTRIVLAVRASGLQHSELWSYRIEGGRLLPTRYGTGSDVQLWSSTDLAVQYMSSLIPRRQ